MGSLRVMSLSFLQREGGRCYPYYRKLEQGPVECSSTGGQLGDNWGTLETRGVASHLYYTLCYLSGYLCITTVLEPVPLPGL